MLYAVRTHRGFFIKDKLPYRSCFYFIHFD